MKTYSIEEVRNLMMQAWRAGFACTSEGHNAECVTGSYQQLEQAGAEIVSEILNGTASRIYLEPLRD